MAVIQISEKGQVLIPKPLRKKLGFKSEGKVQLSEEEGRLILTAVPDDPIAAATGFLKGKFSLTKDLQREHREGLQPILQDGPMVWIKRVDDGQS